MTDMDEPVLPPPPVMANEENDNKDDDSLDDDLPPPPPPLTATPTKINYLTAVTPKPYKSPFASPSTTPSPSSVTMSPVRSVKVSSPLPSLSRPSNFEKKEISQVEVNGKKSLVGQIANFALSDSTEKENLTKEPSSPPISKQSTEETHSRPESQWGISEHHAEKRVFGLGAFSMNPNNEKSPEDVISAPKIVIANPSASSSKSIAKMILGEKAAPTVSKIQERKNSKSLPNLDDPDQVVPLRFQRSEDESEEDKDVVIQAMKEKSPESSSKSVKFALPQEKGSDSNNNDNKDGYMLVRAEPFIEKTSGDTSSKTIAKMILNNNPIIDSENNQKRSVERRRSSSTEECSFCMKPVFINSGEFVSLVGTP